ncbi:hypothetical protein NMY22_g7424 [Coprinellus aureogranulatus]|nr:hypothetical protein NMY22_g7424 [Coprinellus aureogranulatus]
MTESTQTKVDADPSKKAADESATVKEEPPPTLEEGRALVGRLDWVLKAATGLDKGYDLVQARRLIVKLSMRTLLAFNLHNIKSYDVPFRVDAWLKLLEKRPDQYKQEAAELDTEIFKHYPFNENLPTREVIEGILRNFPRVPPGIQEGQRTVSPDPIPRAPPNTQETEYPQTPGPDTETPTAMQEDESIPKPDSDPMNPRNTEEGVRVTSNPDPDVHVENEEDRGARRGDDDMDVSVATPDLGNSEDAEGEEDGDDDEDIEMPDADEEERELKRKTPERPDEWYTDSEEDGDDEGEGMAVKRRKLGEAGDDSEGNGRSKTSPKARLVPRMTGGPTSVRKEEGKLKVKRLRKGRKGLVMVQGLELNEEACDRCLEHEYVVDGKRIHQPCYKQAPSTGKRASKYKGACHYCFTRKQRCTLADVEEVGVAAERERTIGASEGVGRVREKGKAVGSGEAAAGKASGEKAKGRGSWRKGEGSGGRRDDEETRTHVGGMKKKRAGRSAKAINDEDRKKGDIEEGTVARKSVRLPAKKNVAQSAQPAKERSEDDMSVGEDTDTDAGKQRSKQGGSRLGKGRESQTTSTTVKRAQRRRGEEMMVEEVVGESQNKTARTGTKSSRATRLVAPLKDREVALEAVLADKSTAENTLTDIQSEVRVIQRTQEQDRIDILSRFEKLIADNRVTNQDNGERMRALEERANRREQTLLERMSELETKIVRVENRIKEGVMGEFGVQGEPTGQRVLEETLKALFGELKAEIKGVGAESHGDSDRDAQGQRLQDEFTQRIESLAQAFDHHQARLEKMFSDQFDRLTTSVCQRLDTMMQIVNSHTARAQAAVHGRSGSAAQMEGKMGGAGGNYRASSASLPNSNFGVYGGVSMAQANPFQGSSAVTGAQGNSPHMSGDSNAYLSTSAFVLPQGPSHGSRVETPPTSHSVFVQNLQPYSSHGQSYNAGMGEGNMQASVFSTHSRSFPQDPIPQSISQHGAGVSGGSGGSRGGNFFGMTSGFGASTADMTIGTTATDGSARLTTARDGGVPHSVRNTWPDDRSILTGESERSIDMRDV